MKRIIRLTESDLTRIVKRVIKESEEEYVDLTGYKDTITFDYRREKNKKKLIRTLVVRTVDYKTVTENETFTDLVYGYDRFNEKIVMARKDSKFGVNLGLSDVVIYYNCNNGEVRYDETKGSDLQKDSDEDWLKSWCSRIDWSSKVGKKKGLFRK